MHGSRVLHFKILYARQSVFSKETAVHRILECYMHGSLFFSKNAGMLYARQFVFLWKYFRVLYFGMLYVRQSVFLRKFCRVLYFGMLYARQFNSVCSFQTTKLLFRRNNRIWQIGLVSKASNVTPHQTRWHNKKISVKGYSIPLDFLWI